MKGPVDNLVRAFCCHLEAVQSEGGTPKTLLVYDSCHKRFLTFLKQQGQQPPFALDLLNAPNVRRCSIWIRERSRGSRGGEYASRSLVATLKTSSAWLADEGYLELDPLARVKRPRVTLVARTPFGQDEVRALASATVGTLTGARDLAIIRLLLDTGMRVGGLCSVQIEDVNLRDRHLVLRLKGHREHTLYFGSSERRDGGGTVRALKTYIRERDEIVRHWRQRRGGPRDNGRLFLSYDGWPLTTGGVRAVLKRLARDSGIQGVFPHRFRHTFATWYLVRHPGDETGLRGILGHLSDEMYRVYTHLAHEIIAQRAGRVALSEAWLGEESAS